MTRKDFEVIAKAMKWARPAAQEPLYGAMKQQWDDTLGVMLVELDKTNANFNKEKFIKACGGEV